MQIVSHNVVQASKLRVLIDKHKHNDIAKLLWFTFATLVTTYLIISYLRIIDALLKHIKEDLCQPDQ